MCLCFECDSDGDSTFCVTDPFSIIATYECLYGMTRDVFVMQPMSLFSQCAKILWGKQDEKNCFWCWLAACHLARHHAQFGTNAQYTHLVIDGITEPRQQLVDQPIVSTQNLNTQPYLNFDLHCNKSMIKNFMLLHVLYERKLITNSFTNSVGNSKFGYRVSYYGVNSLQFTIPFLRSCRDIFITFLSDYLNWINNDDTDVYVYTNYRAFQAPAWFIIRCKARPYSRNLVQQNYAVCRPSNKKSVQKSDQLIFTEDSFKDSTSINIQQTNHDWKIATCASMMTVFLVGVLTYFILHIFHFI